MVLILHFYLTKSKGWPILFSARCTRFCPLVRVWLLCLIDDLHRDCHCDATYVGLTREEQRCFHLDLLCMRPAFYLREHWQLWWICQRDYAIHGDRCYCLPACCRAYSECDRYRRRCHYDA